MLTRDEAKTRVARGAAHLDVVRPGWFNRIDVGTLTLHDPCGCIVGQLCHRELGAGMNGKLFGDLAASLFGWTEDAGSAFGINITHGDDEGYDDCDEVGPYALLQDAWIESIADRRLAALAAAQADAPAIVGAVR